MNRPTAAAELTVAGEPQSLLLGIKLRAPGHIGDNDRPITVSVPGSVATTWSLGPGEGATVRLLVPETGIVNQRLRLAFADADFGPKPKPVGLSFSEISLHTLPSFPEDNVLSFKASGNAAPFELYGWGHAETAFTWTEGPRAALVLPGLGGDADLDVMISVTPYLAGGTLAEQPVIVRAERQEIARFAVKRAGEHHLRIPKSVLTGDWFTLEFELPSATRPVDVPQTKSHDHRHLALRFSTLRLLPLKEGTHAP